MTNILIGMAIMYLICGLVALICNTFDVDEELSKIREEFGR